MINNIDYTYSKNNKEWVWFDSQCEKKSSKMPDLSVYTNTGEIEYILSQALNDL